MKQIKKIIAENEIVNRAKSKTPRFWKRMQLIGLGIAGIGTLITSAPITIPASIAAWGTYLITVGGTLTTMAQLTKE